jgi:hypothetical protein
LESLPNQALSRCGYTGCNMLYTAPTLDSFSSIAEGIASDRGLSRAAMVGERAGDDRVGKEEREKRARDCRLFLFLVSRVLVFRALVSCCVPLTIAARGISSRRHARWVEVGA